MTMETQTMQGGQDPRRRVHAFAKSGFFVEGRPKPVQPGEVVQLPAGTARELSHSGKVVAFMHGQPPSEEELSAPRKELKERQEVAERERKRLESNAAGGDLADAVGKAQEAAAAAQQAAQAAQQALSQVQALLSQAQTGKGGK